MANVAFHTVVDFNKTAALKKSSAYFQQATLKLTGRDAVEEFLAADIWPLKANWKPFTMEKRKVPGLEHEIPFPVFGLVKPDGANGFNIVSDVEMAASNLVGPYSKKEKKSMILILERAS